MSKQSSLFKFRGALNSEVVGAKVRRTHYLRAYNGNPKNPQTEPQMAVRQAFSLTIGLCKHLTAAFRIGFAHINKNRMTPFNAGMQYNIKNCIEGIYPAQSVNYQKVSIAYGHLQPCETSQMNYVSATNTLTVSWTDTDDRTSLYENALLCVLNVTKPDSIFFTEKREKNTAEITLPNWKPNDIIHCYLAFTSPKEASMTQYLGTATIN
jgi:hypothetical protein